MFLGVILQKRVPYDFSNEKEKKRKHNAIHVQRKLNIALFSDKQQNHNCCTANEMNCTLTESEKWLLD